MALVAAAGVIVLVAVVFAGRFGWQQFVADPVTPDTLMGQPKVSGADGAQVAAEFRSNMGAEFAAGTTSAVAFYSDGRGLGYLLVAVRGGGGKPSGSSGAGSSDPFAGWSKSTAEGATCYSKPAQVAAGAGVTFCVRSLWRRAVVVLGIADLPPDPATVALATNQAWDAQ
jgi:hypothetical protein